MSSNVVSFETSSATKTLSNLYLSVFWTVHGLSFLIPKGHVFRLKHFTKPFLSSAFSHLKIYNYIFMSDSRSLDCWILLCCHYFCSLFILLPIMGHRGFFQVWAILSKAPINIMCRFLCGPNLSTLLRKYPKCWAGRSWGRSMLSFVRDFQNVLQSGSLCSFYKPIPSSLCSFPGKPFYTKENIHFPLGEMFCKQTLHFHFLLPRL